MHMIPVLAVQQIAKNETGPQARQMDDMQQEATILKNLIY